MSNPSPGLERDPGHTIAIAPYPRTVTAKFGDTVIASSRRALGLREADYPAVLYIPFDDIYFEHLERTTTRTQCPFKGTATYWRVTAHNEAETDVMWAYEEPFDEVDAIRGYGAFYPDRVTIDAG